MRALGLMIVVAACGGSSDEGAVIIVRAPDGPVIADQIEIVLASADHVADIDDQRADPEGLAVHAARYYRQRATAGAVAVGPVDGFVIRIEANSAASPDEEFIPFLIARTGGEITGIAAVTGGDGLPATIEILPGTLVEYVVDMVPLAPAVAEAGVAPGESLVVECESNAGPFESGIAWQPGDTAQLRLLLPADGTADASSRTLDMDCDLHEVPDDDCDDLRAAFFVGSRETCDGLDTNCDGARLELVACDLPAGTCGPTSSTDGVAMCIDREGGQLGACTGDPQCLCANGNPGPCTKCILDFQAGTAANLAQPCAPAAGLLALPECDANRACIVEVMPVPGPWRAQVSVLPDGPFQGKVTGVIDKVHLRVELAGTEEVAGTLASSVGEVFLGVSNTLGRRHVGVDLQLANIAPAPCAIADTHAMLCSP
jgi:hypothetical protein